MQLNLLNPMKKKILITLFLGCTIAFAFMTSCKKNSDTSGNESLDSQVSQHNSDANNYQTANDQTDQDVNQSISNIPAMQGPTHNSSGIELRSLPPEATPQGVWTLCGTTIDSSKAMSDKKL